VQDQKRQDLTAHFERLELRPMRMDDIAVLFDQQKDEVAIHMAGFTAKDPQDAAAFMVKTKNLINNPAVDTMAIIVGDQVLGNLMGFEMFGQRAVCYWIGRQYWGCGCATKALSLFIKQNQLWPLTARVAHDNVASLRVLEKCGFKVEGEEVAYAAGRGQEIREFVMSLAMAGAE